MEAGKGRSAPSPCDQREFSPACALLPSMSAVQTNLENVLSKPPNEKTNPARADTPFPSAQPGEGTPQHMETDQASAIAGIRRGRADAMGPNDEAQARAADAQASGDQGEQKKNKPPVGTSPTKGKGKGAPQGGRPGSSLGKAPTGRRAAPAMRVSPFSSNPLRPVSEGQPTEGPREKGESDSQSSPEHAGLGGTIEMDDSVDPQKQPSPSNLTDAMGSTTTLDEDAAGSSAGGKGGGNPRFPQSPPKSWADRMDEEENDKPPRIKTGKVRLINEGVEQQQASNWPPIRDEDVLQSVLVESRIMQIDIPEDSTTCMSLHKIKGGYVEKFLLNCPEELKEYLLDEKTLRVLDSKENTVILRVSDAKADGSAVELTDFEEQEKAKRMAADAAQASERRAAREDKRLRTIPLIYHLTPLHLGAKLEEGELNDERNAISAAIFRATQSRAQVEMGVEFVQLRVKNHLMNSITAYVELPKGMTHEKKKLIEWQHVKRVTFSESHPPLQCHMAVGICDSWNLAPCCFRFRSICPQRNARDCSLFKRPSISPQERKRQRDEAKHTEREADLDIRLNKAKEEQCIPWTQGKVSPRTLHAPPSHPSPTPHCMTVRQPPGLPSRRPQGQKIFTKEHSMRICPGIRVARLRLPFLTRRMSVLRSHCQTDCIVGVNIYLLHSIQPRRGYAQTLGNRSGHRKERIRDSSARKTPPHCFRVLKVWLFCDIACRYEARTRGGGAVCTELGVCEPSVRTPARNLPAGSLCAAPIGDYRSHISGGLMLDCTTAHVWRHRTHMGGENRCFECVHLCDRVYKENALNPSNAQS